MSPGPRDRSTRRRRLIAVGRIVLGLALVAAVGCDNTSQPAVKTLGNSPKASPSVEASIAPSPAPSVSLPPLPPAQFGLSGVVAAPAGIISSNGAGIISSNGAGIISSNGAGIISNNGGGIISSNGAGYRVLDAAGADGVLANAFVTLQRLDEKFYLDAVTGQAFSARTDDKGAYAFPITGESKFPFNQDVIVNAQLADNQRLLGYMIPKAETPNTLKVNLATTVSTEFLRGEARRVGKTLGAFDFTQFKAIVAATEAAMNSGDLPAVAKAKDAQGQERLAANLDLRADHGQDLRNQLAILMSAVGKTNTTLQALSDQWKALFGYRPTAITTLVGSGGMPTVSTDYKAPLVTGDRRPNQPVVAPRDVPLGYAYGVAVARRGDIFIASYTSAPNSGNIRWIRPDGRVTSVWLSTYLLRQPMGIAVEKEPNDDLNNPGRLLVTDAAEHRVYRLPILEEPLLDGDFPKIYMDIIAGEDRPAYDAESEPEHPLYKDGAANQPPVSGTSAKTSRWRLGDEGERRYRVDDTAIANPARFAHLNRPTDVEVDDQGNIYIADRHNHRIRMVPAQDGNYFGYRQAFDDDNDGVPERYAVGPTPMKAGCLYTIAGSPVWDTGRTPDSADGRWFGEFAGDGDRAQLARFDQPVALAFRDGHLYVSDFDNQRIRRMSRTTGILTTVVGRPIGDQQVTGTDYDYTPGTAGDGGKAIDAQLAYPQGIAFDGKGRLFVSDAESGRLRMVDANGVITTVAGRLRTPNGPGATADQAADGLAIGWADLFQVSFLDVDAAGNVVFTDGRHRRARQLWFQWE